jgi:hypothetical protein
MRFCLLAGRGDAPKGGIAALRVPRHQLLLNDLTAATLGRSHHARQGHQPLL